MRNYKKIIAYGLILVGLEGIVGCDKSDQNTRPKPKPKILLKVPTGWHEYHSLGAADFNYDGYPDIITSVDGNVHLYLNKGSYQFELEMER